MKLPPGVLEEGILRIDGSGTTTAKRCQVEGMFTLGYRRVPARRDEAKGFGTATHEGLHELRNKYGSGPYPAEALALMETIVDVEFAGVELPEDEYRTAGRCKEALGLYLKLYPVEDFDILASEVRKEKLLGNVNWTHTVSSGSYTKRCRVVWQGRADFICRDRRSGVVSVFDTKTTRDIYGGMDRLLDEYRMSWTLPMYCWLFSEAPGEGDLAVGQINDCIIDLMIVRKPLQRPSSKSAPRHEFHRLPFHYSSERIEEVKQDVLQYLGQWLTACGHYQQPPPMTGAPEECHRFTNPCGFLKVCEQEGWKRRLHWLNESPEFEDYKWNPMEEKV